MARGTTDTTPQTRPASRRGTGRRVGETSSSLEFGRLLAQFARHLETDDLEQALLRVLARAVPGATAVVSLGGPGARPSRYARAGRVRPWPASRPAPRVLAAPVEESGEALGWIGFTDDDGLAGQRERARDVVIAVAEAAAIPARNARRHAAAIELALRDPLTGVFNRRALEAFLERELECARRYERPLSVILIDVDRFKAINDAHGHVRGDAALRAVAARLAETVRRADLVARAGGDEFAVVLPATTSPDALRLAERIRRAVGRGALETAGGVRLELSISAGVAQFDPRLDRGLGSLLGRADRALYRAKASGRDAVVACGGEPAPSGPVAAATARGDVG